MQLLHFLLTPKEVKRDFFFIEKLKDKSKTPQNRKTAKKKEKTLQIFYIL